jgi:CHASE2 domain-containing sensor protein
VAASVFWFWRTRARPTPKLVVRLVVGAIAAMVTLALLQSINNRVFDPLLEPKPSQAPDGKTQRIIPDSVFAAHTRTHCTFATSRRLRAF